ncbi:MAG: Phosphoserine aminotransferase (EC [uncultured Caballeronia sp.]|nr:MAG: Phosphoserine aminotransferase (EC [uncultured Caballeronia sp.]
MLDIPGNYHVLFMQGGSSLQFSMLPMNFLRGSGKHAEYIVSAYAPRRRSKRGTKGGTTSVVWDGSAEGYRRLPAPDELHLAPDAAYLHYVSNETGEGLEFADIPWLHEVPLVCDMCRNLPGCAARYRPLRNDLCARAEEPRTDRCHRGDPAR